MNTSLEFKDKVFVVTLKNYLKECENAAWTDKDKIVTNIMDYLVENAELFNLEKHTVAKQLIFDKLVEFKTKGFNSNKYFELLYPEYYNTMIKEVTDAIDAIALDYEHKPRFYKGSIDSPEVILDNYIPSETIPIDDYDDDLPDLVPANYVAPESVPIDDDDVPDLVPGDNIECAKFVPIDKYNCFRILQDQNGKPKIVTSPWLTSTIEPDTNLNKIEILTPLPNNLQTIGRPLRIENLESIDIKGITEPIFLTSTWTVSDVKPDTNLFENKLQHIGSTGAWPDDMKQYYDKLNENIVQMNLIFEDYKTTIFTKTYYRLNFVDSMFQYICEKYNVTDKSLILNNDVAIEKVKIDKTFPNGHIIIKLNENSYELYEKQTNITNGYVYGVYTNVVINKLGKFGKISH